MLFPTAGELIESSVEAGYFCGVLHASTIAIRAVAIQWFLVLRSRWKTGFVAITIFLP